MGKNPGNALRLNATKEQTEIVQRIIRHVASKGKIFEVFPEFKRCVDELPSLPTTLALPVDLYVPILDAFVSIGVDVPIHVWEALGAGQFAGQRR